MTERRLVVVGGGMLATAILGEATAQRIPSVSLPHSTIDVSNLASVSVWAERLSRGDIVINCAGIRPGGYAVDMVLVNSLGPWILASALERRGIPLVHISTDCVFSGWTESAPVRHTATDTPNPDSIYGRTKLAGEVLAPNTTVVRTSFVGPAHGLWAWVSELPYDAQVEGWEHAWWSGSAVWTVAHAIVEMTRNPLPSGVIHIATASPITKCEAVSILAERIGRRVRVLPTDSPRIDRSLEPSPGFEIPSLKAALQ